MSQAFGCPHFKLIHFLCALESKESCSGIFLLRQNFYHQRLDTSSVCSRTAQACIVCHFPVASATPALEGWKGLRNTAREKGIPEAARRVVTSQRVCSALQAGFEGGGKSC